MAHLTAQDGYPLQMHDLRRATLQALGLLFLLTCTSRPSDPSQPGVLEHVIASSAPAEEPAALATMQPEIPEPASAPVVTNPYAGWRQWCEPQWYDTTCRKESDCASIQHVAGRPLRCSQTRSSKRDGLLDNDGNPLKFCVPGFSNKTERRWRRARLREIVAQAYFEEPEYCSEWSWETISPKNKAKRFERIWANGKPTHHQHWRCTREWRQAEVLANFLWVPYFRETTARPWKRHRLDPDVEANKTAWVNEASDYGWIIEMQCEDGRKLLRAEDGKWRDANGRRCRKGRDMAGKYTRSRLVIAGSHPDPDAEFHNPYYANRLRWQYGLGAVGKNTAYGVQDWDVMAPPEILCREFEGFEAYLRDARHAVTVLRGGGVDCGDPTKYHGIAIRQGDGSVVEEPSWFDVHRVASSGKFCPRKGAKSAEYRRKFRRRMISVGLNPDHPVTDAMLGQPIEREGQNARAAEILGRIDDVLPMPWEDPRTDPAEG